MSAAPHGAAQSGPALTELSDDALLRLVEQLGGKPFQGRQVLHWLWKHGVDDVEQMRNVPAKLREALRPHRLRAAEVREAELAQDGTEKLLVGLADGDAVECVIIPDGERTTLCISTQVGCPVGCVFCASGLGGVRRNLTAGEIAEQVLLAKARLPDDRRLTNLVVMGMGEPMLNLDNLEAALRMISRDFEFSPRRITISTSGYPDRVAALAKRALPWNLAISLHAADSKLRKDLVPTAHIAQV